MSQPWYAHPTPLPSREDQVAWRRAVEEVAELTGERSPTGRWNNKPLPGSNTFVCETCSEPTYEHQCVLCLDGM